MTQAVPSTRENRYNTQRQEPYLFQFDQLEKIASQIGIAQHKIDDGRENVEVLHRRCFKAILRSCEQGDWEKVNKVVALIFGIKDERGRTVYEVLTDMEDGLPFFCSVLPENLVFQGGGPKGPAYIGALQVLEKYNALLQVKRAAGTSVGALIGALIAVGYTSSELKELFIPLIALLDPPSSFGGLCAGDKFLHWVDRLIEQKTGIKYCTLGELARKIKAGELFKHLYVFAVRAGTNQELIQFDSENKECDELVISGAVRASVSLPAVFEPYSPCFKNANNEIYFPLPYSLMDGGLIYNLPTTVFDKKKYVMKTLSKLERECPVVNKRTLAFSLYSPGEKIEKEDKKITCILFAYQQSGYIREEAEMILRKSKPYDAHRTVYISNVGVDTFLGVLEGADKTDELINSGRASTEVFFLEREERRQKLKAIEESKTVVHRQKEITKHSYVEYRNGVDGSSLLGVEIMGEKITFHSDYVGSLSHLIKRRFPFSVKSLAEQDCRFRIFTLLDEGNTNEADQIFENNRQFFENCFLWDIFLKLIIELNQDDYIRIFTRNNLSFKVRNFEPLWYAYKHKAYKAFATLSHIYPLDLKSRDSKGRNFLHAILQDTPSNFLNLYNDSFLKEFCSLFKVLHPKSYKEFLSETMLTNAESKRDALDIAQRRVYWEDTFEFLVEEGANFETKIDALAHCLPTLMRDDYCGDKSRGTKIYPIYYSVRKIFEGGFKSEISSHSKMRLLVHSCGHGPLRTDNYEVTFKLVQSQFVTFPKEDFRTKHGNGPLLLILKSSHLKWKHKQALVKLLINGEHPDDVNQANDCGETPLIMAAQSNFVILETLLERDEIQVNLQDEKGNTALHYAAQNFGKRRVEALLQNEHINANIRNNLGQTPLHLAWDFPETKIMRLLKEKGADDTIRDNKGRTPQEFFESQHPIFSAVVKETKGWFSHLFN